MEPRSFDRGKAAGGKGAVPLGIASMEPRSFDRGKIVYAIPCRLGRNRFNGAAIV